MSRRRVITKKINLENKVPVTNLREILSRPNIIQNGLSLNTVSYSETNICEDNIYLVSQFFLHKDSQRRKEISHCLKKNCEIFDKIFLLNEREYSLDELQLSEEDFKKIEQIIIGRRMSYKYFLDFCKNRVITGYFILANSDIFFDSTVFNLRKGFLNCEKSIYALSRHEINSEGKISEETMLKWSQDAWIIHSNYFFENTNVFDIFIGKPGCDNKVLYLFYKLRFKIYNCPYFIKIFHYHENQERDYTFKDTISPPYIHAEPIRTTEKVRLIEKSYHITEDSIADWVNKNNGIMLTRKYNTIRNNNFKSNYVCLTGSGQIIDAFEKRILPKLQKKIILILIESDVIKISRNIIENDMIEKIFQWNKEIQHPKIKCIPIGLNRDRQLSMMMNTPKPEKKEKLVLLNFDVKSHPIRRKIGENKELMNLCSKMDYLPPDKLYHINTATDGKLPIHVTNKNYYKELGKYKFVLSPRGGGEDCHRTWEALYMGCIPIVLSSSIDEVYKDLPVLVVKCWSEITRQLLNETWEEYQKKEWKMEKLTMHYWLKQFEYSDPDEKEEEIHFITYGNEVFEKAKQRLTKEARNFYNFKSVRGYGPEDLDDKFKEKYKDVLSQERGGGYWIWRYHLIEKLLNNIQENEIIIYLDAGCHFNPKGMERFEEYITLLKESKYGMLSFQMNDQIEKFWTVKEIFDYFKIDREGEIGNSGQYLGGVLFIKKCKHSMEWIKRILTILEEDRNLFTDYYNNKNQKKYFKDNRHEQSVSSVLRKIMGSEVIPKDETWHPQPFGCQQSLKYPIWAMRSKR